MQFPFFIHNKKQKQTNKKQLQEKLKILCLLGCGRLLVDRSNESIYDMM